MSSLVFSVFLATVFFLALQRFVANRVKHAKAWRHGCRPVNRYPHTHPLGYDLYRARVGAVKTGRRNKFSLELFEKYGTTFEERAFTTRVINTADRANLQAVAATQFKEFRKDDRRSGLPFFGSGILSMDGPQWRQTRDLVTPLFTRAQLQDVEQFQKFVDRMFDLLPRDGRTVDLQPLLQKLFLDSCTEFIFGESIDSLRDTTTKSQEFLKAFNLALAGAGKRMNTAGPFGFLYGFDKSWEKSYSKVHAYIDEKIAQYFERSTKEGDAQGNAQQRYVLVDAMSKHFRDPIELRFQLLNIFFPARDTTAIAVSNAIFFLARYPHVWRELREEALALGDEPLTFELLKSLRSFRYTLFEAIRLQGPSGQVRRRALHDTTLPRGGGLDGSAPMFVPKGTLLNLNNIPASRDPSIWGYDVEVFRPSRFNGKLLNWEFTPFFGGPRICPASNQVITQSVYLLVRLVKEFEAIECRDECWEYVEATRMLVESRNGVKVALHPITK